MFSLKNTFPANNLFRAFRLRRAYVDVTIATFKNQNGGRSPIENKQPVGTQRAYFELKYFKIVKMRDAKYSLKMAAEKWRQKFPFLNALYS